jgi:2',3'-cyclic-nucleotide 2'-phosphodiesterase (5'-nucleotidase family)
MNILQIATFLLLQLLASASSLSPNLPFGDINVLVLTDVHSWVGGHGEKEPHLNADYGDVLSFYERLKEYTVQSGKDLWFVVNGDWIDGTGLAANGDPSRLIPLLEKMPWDALNIGNHELYKREVIEYVTQPGGFVEWWGDKYLSSNIVLTNSQEPIGNPYRLLRGKKSTLLTFGFLFNMKDNDQIVTVKEVESVVREEWFTQALRGEEYDAILVMAHMDVQDPLVDVILAAIRLTAGSDVPVQFITGHTHHRGFYNPDNTSASFEAGRYLDTVGFCSFPNRATAEASGGNVTSLFKYEYLDANIDLLKETLGGTELETENGVALSTFISKVQKEMGLEEVISCTEDAYYTNRSLDEEGSLWGFFRDRVVPSQFQGDKVVFLGKGGWRYDLLPGEIRIDDLFAVSPFNETLYEWKSIPSEVIVMLNTSMNENSQSPFLSMLPEYILAPTKPFIPAGRVYDLITDAFEVSRIQNTFKEFYPNATTPVALTDITTTSCWIDFFRENYLCRETPKKRPVFPTFGFGSNTTVTRITERDPQTDQLRLVFAAIAACTVFVLGVISVRQRGTAYDETVRARDQLIFEALQEYEGDEGEGEFV